MITYYKGNYKYQLALSQTNPDVVERESVLWLMHELRFTVQAEVKTPYLALRKDPAGPSYLFIRSGYAWDGASGPTIDTKDTQTASLVHDALWQLIASGHLPESFRNATNNEFYYILRSRKVPQWRAKLWKAAVEKAGKYWVRIFSTNRKLISAP